MAGVWLALFVSVEEGWLALSAVDVDVFPPAAAGVALASVSLLDVVAATGLSRATGLMEEMQLI